MKYSDGEQPSKTQRLNLQGGLWELYKARCAYCNVRCVRFGVDSDIAATIDHYVPLERGGTWAFSNLRLACWKCNNEKGNLLPEAWFYRYPAYKRDVPTPEQADVPMSRYERKLAAYALIHQRTKENENVRSLERTPDRTGP